MGTKKVIDVSYHNGTIDWEKVKAAGVDGAILRCGYGDNIASQDDKQWKRNADECTRLGIPFGAYLYSYAKSTAQAKSEAEHALRLIKGYKLSYPVYYDLEEHGTESGAVERAKIFCEAIEAAGYCAGIYCNKSWWDNYLNSLGNTYTKWIARYNDTLGMDGVDMWQYTSDGSVSGISGRVDMNHCYRDFPKEITGSSSGANTGSNTSGGSSDKKKDLGNVDLYYSAYAGGKWWPEVKNATDWAGKGNDFPITYLGFRVTKGSLKARAYTRKSGWLPYITFKNSYNKNDLVNGVIGDGSEILAVELYYNTPSGYNYKYAKYKVSVKGKSGYYPEQRDNETGSGMDGYAGDKKNAVDKFQAWIE